MRNKLSAIRETIVDVDWRIYVILGAISLIEIGCVPLFRQDTYVHGFQYDTLRKVFSSPVSMIVTYWIFGLGCLLTLRSRYLAFFISVGIALLLYFISNQLLSNSAPPYSVFDSVITALFMSYAFFKGGGFSINRKMTDNSLSRSEKMALREMDKMEKAMKRAKKMSSLEE